MQPEECMEETGTYLTVVGTLPTETSDDTSHPTTVWQQQQYVMYLMFIGPFIILIVE